MTQHAQTRDIGALPRFAAKAYKSVEGSQLLEFALVLPLLLVLVVGIANFAQAFNLKQELNNAAREGARYGASQSSQPGDVETKAAAQAVGNVVQNYLTNAGLTACTFSAPTPTTYLYTYAGSPAGCSLVIDRDYVYTTVSGGTATATRVTLGYPYGWNVGASFSSVMRLFVPGSATALPSSISSDAVMQNL